MYEIGDNGEHIRKLQRRLMALDYPLPRYGDDSDMGRETKAALEMWVGKVEADDLDVGFEDEAIPIVATRFMRETASLVPISADGIIRVTGAPRNNKRHRAKNEIDAIVLHQTGCRMNLNSWKACPIHFGIPRTSNEAYQIHDVHAYLWHANGFNKRSIGIEIEGNFEGLSGDRSTWWKQGGGPDRPQASQVELVRKVIHQIVRDSGLDIKYIFAHRQSSKNRIADPGESVWKSAGAWAMKEFGLSCGDGPSFKIGSGYPLPKDWTGSSESPGYYS